MKTLLLITLITLSVFAQEDQLANLNDYNLDTLVSSKKYDFLKKDKYENTLELFNQIVEENVLTECKNNPQCNTDNIKELKNSITNQVLIKSQGKTQVDANFIDNSIIKEGGWNFEGKMAQDIDLLTQSIISDYMEIDGDIDLVSFTLYVLESSEY